MSRQNAMRIDQWEGHSGDFPSAPRDRRIENRVRLLCIWTLSICILLAGCSPSALPGETSITNPSPSEKPATPPAPTTTTYSAREHVIGVRQVKGVGEFYNRVTGETFVLRGVNYVYVPHGDTYNVLTLKVGVYDSERTRQDFLELAAKGYNTVRVFLDHCGSGVGCIGDIDNKGLNPEYLDNIADMLAAADEADIFIQFTSNDLPDQGGYSEQANAESGEVFAGYRNSYYLTASAVAATRRYWGDILAGLQERSAATERVLGWQLLNEQWMFLDQPPLSLTSGEVQTTTGVYDMSDPDQKRQMVSDGLIHYIAEIKDEILEHDPTALVTMGFFTPEIVAPGWYVETRSLLTNADLDYFDFHAYPGFQPLRELVQEFGMEGYDTKPIVLGEYGAFRNVYPDIIPAARSITSWQAESCSLGFDGWIYWTYYPAAEKVDDRTWAFTDNSGYLLDLLAPTLHPDPCEQVQVASDNLAYQKTVTASASLLEEPPEYSVDENATSQWGSGRDAPQWIEVDLGQSYKITEIQLLVAQWPEGPTIHRILGGNESGKLREFYVFNQATAGGDRLIFTPEVPLDDIRIIRIETLNSPSWVAWGEIQVFGDPSP